jgi:hypothetical protein
LLHQACAHCAIFPTAASRRSLGRISVPVWPVALSGRLPVEALVSHYLTNKLIGREPIPDRRSFPPQPKRVEVISGISSCFQLVFRSQGQVAHVLLTRSPLVYPRRGLTVRLACVKHAASVRPEPGSNSPLKNIGNHDPSKEAMAVTVKNNELDLDIRPNWVNQFQSQRNHTRPEPTPPKDRDSLAEHGFDSAIWH